jgi:hypothetical protein
MVTAGSFLALALNADLTGGAPAAAQAADEPVSKTAG